MSYYPGEGASDFFIFVSSFAFLSGYTLVVKIFGLI